MVPLFFLQYKFLCSVVFCVCVLVVNGAGKQRNSAFDTDHDDYDVGPDTEFINLSDSDIVNPESSEEDDFEDDIYAILHSALRNFTASKPISLAWAKNATEKPTIVVEDDDVDYDKINPWRTKDTVEGYKISSDGLQFRTKFLKKQQLLQIRIDVGSAWTLEKEYVRRDLNLKIGTWEKTYRVQVKVPYGVVPQELKVSEAFRYIDIYAPYGFLEIQNNTATNLTTPQ